MEKLIRYKVGAQKELITLYDEYRREHCDVMVVGGWFVCLMYERSHYTVVSREYFDCLVMCNEELAELHLYNAKKVLSLSTKRFPACKPISHNWILSLSPINPN